MSEQYEMLAKILIALKIVGGIAGIMSFVSFIALFFKKQRKRAFILFVIFLPLNLLCVWLQDQIARM